MTQQAQVSEQSPQTTQPPEAAAAVQTLAESSRSAGEASQGRPDEPITATSPDAEIVETLGDAPALIPDEERRAKFTDVAERARRDRLRRQRESKEAQDARLERDRAAREADANAQRAEAIEREARDNPEGFLRARGITPQMIAAKAVEEAALLSTPEGQIRSLRSELEREREARERSEASRAAADDAQRARQAQADFIREADDAEQYPTLSRLAQRSPETLQREGEAVAQRVHARTGRYPSFPQILAYLEHEFGKAFTSGGTTQRQTREPARAAQPGKSQTLTSRTAERALPPKPFEEMSREEQRAYLLTKLE